MSSTLASGSLYYTASSLTQPTVQVDINAAAEKSFAAINNNSLESTSTKNRFSSCFLLLPPPLRRVPKKKLEEMLQDDVNTNREGFLIFQPSLPHLCNLPLSRLYGVESRQRFLLSGASFSHRGYPRTPIILTGLEKQLLISIVHLRRRSRSARYPEILISLSIIGFLHILIRA